MDIANLNIRVQQTGVNEANAGLGLLARRGRESSSAIRDFEQSSRLGNSSASAFASTINNLYRALGGLGAGYLALKSIRMVDEFTLLEGRVRTSTESITEATYAWDSLLESAKETGVGMEGSVNVLQRISFVRDEIDATAKEMVQFTDTVNKMGVAGGASTDAMKFGLTQLGQSLSSEFVRAEEFNSIMENIPSVGRAIADELGITTGELRRLVIEGRLLSKDVFAALLNQADEAQEKFNQLPDTVGRSFGTLMIRIQDMLKGFDEATGATSALIWTIEKLGDALEVTFNLMEFLAYGLEGIFTDIVGSITSLIVGILNGIEAVVNAGVRGVNVFKKDKLSEFDFTGGLTSKDIVEGQTDISGELYRKAGQSARDANSVFEQMIGIGSDKFGPYQENSARQVETDYKKIVDALGEGNKEEEKAAKLIAKTIDELKFKNEQFGRSIEDQELYNELRAANVEIDSAAGRQIEELVRQHQELEREQENLNRIIDSVDDGFKSLWTNAINGGEDWRSAMRNIVNDVSSMFYDMFIKNDIRKLIGGLFGNSTGGFDLGGIGGLFSGSFGSSNIGIGIQSAFSGGAYGPGFAEGGSFKVGGVGGTDSQLVSFRASPDETVTITRPDQQNTGGNQIHYNIDARGADAGVEERLMNALRTVDRSIEARAMSAVDVQFKRNPAYGRR